MARWQGLQKNFEPHGAEQQAQRFVAESGMKIRNHAQDKVDPHKFGYCFRYAMDQTCVGCGDPENGKAIRSPKEPRTQIPKGPQEPISAIEFSIVSKMQANVTFPPGHSHKRFIRDLSEKSLLTDRGRQYLAFIAHRYRKQFFQFCHDDEIEWIIARKSY